MGPFTYKSRKIWSVIYFLFKKGGQSYTWQCWKRGLFGTYIRTMSFIGSYPPPTPTTPPPSPPPQELSAIRSLWQITKPLRLCNHHILVKPIICYTMSLLVCIEHAEPRKKGNSFRKHAYSNILRILPTKNENFQMKISHMFLLSAQNIDYGYSLEPPRWGGCNEYPQLMFLSRIYTPVNPSFTI